MQEQATEQRQEEKSVQGSAGHPEGMGQVVPFPNATRRMMRPWEKLAAKIKRKMSLDLPPLLIPLLARIEREYQARGVGVGVSARVVLECTGLEPKAIETLIHSGVLQMIQATGSALARPDVPLPRAIQLHPRIAELVRPLMHDTDAIVKWAAEAAQAMHAGQIQASAASQPDA